MVNTPPLTGNAQLDKFLRSVADDLRTLAKPREGWRLSDFSADVSEVISDRRDLIDIVRAWGRIEDLEDSLADELKKHLDLYDTSLSLNEDMGGLVGTFSEIQRWWDENPALYLEDRAKISNALSKAESALSTSQTATSKATSAETKAASAETKVDTYTPRVEALEAMNGVSPESPVDGQTANLIEQEDTLTRSAVDSAADNRMGARNLAAYDTKVYEGEVTGEVVTLAGSPRADVSIANALPEVTLAQVQSLDPDADLSDSADWYSLQSLIDDCVASKVRAIKVPRGTYYMSRGLDLSGLEYGTDLDMPGVILRAVKEMPRMIWLEHRGNYWKARRINIHGLEIRGRYLVQRGVDIEQVQEWSVDVRVHECYIGVAMADTWYGKLSRETIIQDCLTGIAFLKRNTSEVNTIGLDNVKINLSVPKSRFTLTPDADSIAISISTILAGINFHTLVVEGMDYGVKYIPSAVGVGSQRGLVMFTGCYWEAIKKRVFDFSEYAADGHIHMFNSVIIRGNRFFNTNAEESIFGPGEHEITGNQAHKIRIMKSTPTRVTMRIDDAVELVEAPVNQQIFIDRTPAVPVFVNADRFSDWGDTNRYPQDEPMLHTIEHAGYRTVPSMRSLRGINSGSTSKITPTYNITGRPTVYLPGLGDTPNGPVVSGVDGWYMILLGDDGVLTTRQVKNMQRLDEGTTSRTGKELHLMTSSEELGVQYRCIDSNTDVWLGMWNGEHRWVDDSGRLRIGTTEELWQESSKFVNGNRLFDVNTGQAIIVRTGNFDHYDWFGETMERVVGPVATRRSNPTAGLIHYDPETKTHTQYLDGEWVDFTPNATT